MTSSFKLTLDTLAPAASAQLNGGLPVTSQLEVLLEMVVEDAGPLSGYQFLAWGEDIDPEGNEHIQPKEEDSDWIAFGAGPEKNQAIILTEGDGPKVVFLQIRDDVWNATEVFELTVELNTSVPTITITAGPSVPKISEVPTKDLATFTFKADEDLGEWKVEVVATEGSAEGTGTLIEEGGGSDTQGGELEGEKNQEGKIKGIDLDAATGSDGQYIIKVFGKSVASGLWSL